MSAQSLRCLQDFRQNKAYRFIHECATHETGLTMEWEGKGKDLLGRLGAEFRDSCKGENFYHIHKDH